MRSIVNITHFMIDTADSQPQRVVNLPHPNGVSSGKVIIDGDDMDALVRNSVKIRWQSGDQSLALAGPHLGDFPLMQK